MARTKQTARGRRQSDTTIFRPRHFFARAVAANSSPPPPSGLKRELAEKGDEEDDDEWRCYVCGGNMESFLRETEDLKGCPCPPCQRGLRALDTEQRRQTNPQIGLFVPDDESLLPQVVELGPRKEVLTRLFGTGDDEPRPREHVWFDNDEFRVRYVMEHLDVDDVKEKFPVNNRAERIAMDMNEFNLCPIRSLRGPVLFVGPNWQSLTSKEVARFCDIASIKLRIP